MKEEFLKKLGFGEEVAVQQTKENIQIFDHDTYK